MARYTLTYNEISKAVSLNHPAVPSETIVKNLLRDKGMKFKGTFNPIPLGIIKSWRDNATMDNIFEQTL